MSSRERDPSSGGRRDSRERNSNSRAPSRRRPGSPTPSTSRSDQGEKRGRDRSGEASSSSRNKIPKKDGNGKKRHEFVDQLVTRAPMFDKRSEDKSDELLKLKANFFKLTSTQRFTITLYRVDFEPETEIRGIRFNLIGQHRSILGGYMYDGGNQLYLSKALTEHNVALQSQSREGNKFLVKLKKTREILYTEGSYLQVCNIMVRRAMDPLQLQLVNRNLYDARAAFNVSRHQLQIWPGYISSVRQHEYDLLLNCEISHKVMRNQNVWAIIQECMNSGGDYKTAAHHKILGTTVLTDYNQATYKIHDIDWDQTPASTFTRRGVEVAFSEYYKEKYNLNILVKNQPLLVSKANARNIRSGQPEFILLVPELCRATGITDEMRNNFSLMRDLSTFTRLSPVDRIKRLKTFVERLTDNSDSVRVFNDNSTTLDRELVTINAKRKKQETILFGLNQIVNLETDIAKDSPRDSADWTRCLASKVMYKPVMREKLTKWFYVYPMRCSVNANDFMRNFLNVAVSLCGRSIPDPTTVEIRNNQVDITNYTRELQKIIRTDPSFIMIVVPNNRADLYAALKRTALCRDSPVSIQVIVEKTINNQQRLMSIATKVAIQVNCKLGGIPWHVDLVLPDIMIIGFDVTHDKSKKNSFGAMVAHMNPMQDGGQYFSTVKKHENGQEFSTNVGSDVMLAVKKYVDLFEALPKRILIYRDGVGDGQIEYVVNQELKDIVKKLEYVYSQREIKPHLGFVIVNKKTNTRLFKYQGSNYSNPLPGTIVDDVITLPERYDFYLVSQSVREGTVSPTYYNVIKDEFFEKKPKVMQTLTFKLCHNYFNWSGTTRIPSVVQYAKKLAMLVGQHLQQAPRALRPDQQLYFL